MGRRRRSIVVEEPEAPAGPPPPLAPVSPRTGDPEPETPDDGESVAVDEGALLADEQRAYREADERVSGGDLANEVDSIKRASFNIDAVRVWGARADLYRTDPQEFKSVHIGGFVRRWVHPFDVADIENWTRIHRGGNKYQLRLYNEDRELKRVYEFECEGNPILPGAVPGEDEAAAGFAPPPKPGAPGAPLAAGATTDDRVAALERRLLQQDFQHQLEQQRTAADRAQKDLQDQLRRMEERMTAQAAVKPPEPVKQGPGLLEVIAALGASPVVASFVTGMQATAVRSEKAVEKTAELTMKMIEAGEHRTAEMLKSMAGRQEKPGDMIDMIVKMKQLAQGGEGAEAKAFSKIIDHALPALINATTRIQMHQAGVRDDGDDEPETFAEKMLGKAGDVLGGFFSSMGQRRAAAGPYGPPMVGGPAPQQSVPMPVIPPGPRGAAMLGAMGMGQPSIIMPRGAPPTAAAPSAPAQPSAQAGPMLEAPTTAPPPAPQAAPQGQALPDINEAVLQKALLYMSQGKAGSELADDLMTEEEAREKAQPGSLPLYLSKRVITLLCTQPPEQVLGFIYPYIQQAPQYAPLTDQIGVVFLTDFCKYFSEPEDGDEPDPITGASRGPKGA